MNMRQSIVLLVIAGLLFYFGTNMFYETGLGATGLGVNKTDDSNYQVSYVLRSVRSFDYLDCEYFLLDSKGNVIATGQTILENITDGSFPINETLSSVNGSSLDDASKIELRIYEEKFNPDLKNSDGSYSQKVFFEQSADI